MPPQNQEPYSEWRGKSASNASAEPEVVSAPCQVRGETAFSTT